MLNSMFIIQPVKDKETNSIYFNALMSNSLALSCFFSMAHIVGKTFDIQFNQAVPLEILKASG